MSSTNSKISNFKQIDIAQHDNNLTMFHNCNGFQIRREYGCYDEVFLSNYSLNKRQCNWIRFLRIVQSYDEQVNLIGTKIKGKLVDIIRKSDLV